MIDSKKSAALETVFLFTSIFPLALCMGVCSGMGAGAGLLFAVVASLAADADRPKPTPPVYLAFLVVFYAFGKFNAATVSLAVIVSGVLLVASSLFPYKPNRFIAVSAGSGAALAGALSATVFFTDDYFGIGASGFSVADILASYRSLGFHANWRGVLYGTVVLVIMITFPRKFKKTGKIFSASFLSLAVALVLNLFLNPSYMKTAINETGGFSYKDAKNVILPLLSEKPNFGAAFVCGAALFVVSYFTLSQRKVADGRGLAIAGAANGALGFLCSTFLPRGIRRDKRSFVPGLISASACAVLLFALDGLIARIPVHACAVVLIVGAWQSVEWGELRNAFSRAADALCFSACFVSVLILGAADGIPLAAAFSVLRRTVFAANPAREAEKS